MKKTCSRAIETSRADSGRTMSRHFATRNSPFDASGKTGERPVSPEWPDDLFLMNRFYGEAVLEPLIGVLREEVAGEKSGLLAETLEKEMQAKKGCIRGDALWEILKNGLGMACAARLIAGLTVLTDWDCMTTGLWRVLHDAGKDRPKLPHRDAAGRR